MIPFFTTAARTQASQPQARPRPFRLRAPAARTAASVVAAGLALFAGITFAASSDRVFYAGNTGKERFYCVQQLSDGTVLVGGEADNLNWVPGGVPQTQISAGSINSVTNRTAFLLHLSSDLGTILDVVHFPPNTVRNVFRIHTSEVPGQPTGDLFISGHRDTGLGSTEGYYLAKLNHNFVNGTPTAMVWSYDAQCRSATSGYKDIQPWDVSATGEITFGSGLEYDPNWANINRLDSNGVLKVVQWWPAHWTATGEWDGSPASSYPGQSTNPVLYSGIVLKTTRAGTERSVTQADFDAILPDGHGQFKKGRYPDDFYVAGPNTTSGRGYTGNAASGNPTDRLGQIAIDRRTGYLYYGYSAQTTDVDGQPDFEPALVGMDDIGRVVWWSRLYEEMHVVDGVDKSTDSAGTWTGVTNGLANHFVRALATSTNAVYAGTYGGGVFKSTDAGANWTALTTGLGHSNVLALAIAPARPATVFAGTAGGVFKSVNAGTNWATANTGLTNLYVTALAVQPGSSNLVLAGTAGGGAFKSSDGGGSWTGVTGLVNNGNTLYVFNFAFDPVTPTTVYAATFGDGVYKSTDTGSTWSKLSGQPGNQYIYSLAINPSNTATIFAGTHGKVYATSNGGTSWATAGSATMGDGPVRCVAISPASTNVVYAGHGYRGIYKSSDGGTTWAGANTGLPSYPNTQGAATLVYALALDPAAASTLFLGSIGFGRSSIPDQYVDAVAVDYSTPTNNAQIAVIARSHGNDYSNYFPGDSITTNLSPANPGTAYHNGFTGSSGNAHLSWLGRLRATDGTMLFASWNAEYNEGAGLSYGSAYSDPNLDGWPNHNAGWPDLNTTKCRTELTLDATGQAYLAATGRRTITTKNAYQRNANPHRPGNVTAGTSTTVFRSDALKSNAFLTSAAPTCTVTFTSGTNNGQTRNIAAFDTISGTATLTSALPGTPASNDTFWVYEGIGSWNDYVRVFNTNLTSLTYSSMLMGQWDTKTGAGGGNTTLEDFFPINNGVFVVGYHQADASNVALGNPIPTQNIPAWGTNAPSGESAIIARLLFSDPTGPPTVTVNASLPTAQELGPVNGQFTITLSNPTNITIYLAIAGSASNGVDYTLLPASVAVAGTTNLTTVPIPDNLPEGDETVSLTILPGAGYVAGSPSNAVVTINDKPMDNWRVVNFGANATNATIACDLCNPAGDGIANLLKYALNLNPNIAGLLPGAVATNNHLTLTYLRRKPPTDVTYAVEVNGNLTGSWTTNGVTEVLTPVDSTFDSSTATDPATISSNIARFIRLHVTRP